MPDGLHYQCKACTRAANRRRLETPEGRARVNAASRATRGTPEGRDKRNAATRASHAKRKAQGLDVAYLVANPLYKLRKDILKLFHASFRRRKWGKQTKTQKLLGCSFEEFKTHIEGQFLPGMTWENHGSWHYDHVIPCNCAGNILELEALQHWSNFQPLWGSDNLSKGPTPPDNWKERLAALMLLLDK
jgi:hypothetical protein